MVNRLLWMALDTTPEAATRADLPDAAERAAGTTQGPRRDCRCSSCACSCSDAVRGCGGGDRVAGRAANARLMPGTCDLERSKAAKDCGVALCEQAVLCAECERGFRKMRPQQDSNRSRSARKITRISNLRRRIHRRRNRSSKTRDFGGKCRAKRRSAPSAGVCSRRFARSVRVILPQATTRTHF